MNGIRRKSFCLYITREPEKEKIRSNFLDIIDIFAKADYEITVYPTQSQGDGRKAVVERKKKFFDLIVCCGGDGTLDEVVSGMMYSSEKLPIGYVPAGSTNDFASSLGIPGSNESSSLLHCERPPVFL